MRDDSSDEHRNAILFGLKFPLMILTCEMTDKLRHHYFNEIFQRLHLFTMEKPQVLNTPISFRFKIALTQKFVQKSFAHYFVCFYTSYNGYVFYLSRFQF